MAVSHQWFMQWSAPPMVITDITSQYNDFNERWNNDKPKWSDPIEIPENSDDSHNDYPKHMDYIENNNYDFKADSLKNKGELKKLT